MNEHEIALMEHAKAMLAIIKEYGCPSGYLSIGITRREDSYLVCINNEYWAADSDFPIQIYKTVSLKQEATNERQD